MIDVNQFLNTKEIYETKILGWWEGGGGSLFFEQEKLLWSSRVFGGLTEESSVDLWEVVFCANRNTSYIIKKVEWTRKEEMVFIRIQNQPK